MRLGYRRVSTADQSLDRQQLPEIDKMFEEKLSGAKRDRPALAQLVDYAREGDAVVVHSLDRLARDMRDLLAIVERLNVKGASVELLSEGLKFDPAAEADPFAKLQLHMLSAFAEFERSLIRKRQREGIERARAKGVYKGRPLSIDRERVVALHRSGMGAAKVAREVGASRASVYRILGEAGAA